MADMIKDEIFGEVEYNNKGSWKKVWKNPCLALISL